MILEHKMKTTIGLLASCFLLVCCGSMPSPETHGVDQKYCTAYPSFKVCNLLTGDCDSKCTSAEYAMVCVGEEGPPDHCWRKVDIITPGHAYVFCCLIRPGYS